jgi:sterol desaturase/sphingolipid hydroxylase (fatty acid hydroxylase superfamily)
MWIPHTSLLHAANVDSVLGSLQSFLARLGLGQFSQAASLWVFFAACGVTELAISFLVCTPLERFWPLTSWPKRNSIAADVTYAFFVRIVLFPLIAYFEFNWLRQSLDGFLRAHAITPPSLSEVIPVLASWPAFVFIANFAILDLADYWRHRVSGGTGFTHCITPKSS